MVVSIKYVTRTHFGRTFMWSGQENWFQIDI